MIVQLVDFGNLSMVFLKIRNYEKAREYLKCYKFQGWSMFMTNLFRNKKHIDKTENLNTTK